MLIHTHKCYKLLDGSFAQITYDSYGCTSSTNVVLCIHGVGLNSLIFSDIRPSFPEAFKILTPDLLGHGRSDHVNQMYYNIQSYAEDCLNVLNSCRFKQVSIVGHGIGALIAMRIASMKNSFVNSVVLDFVEGQIDPELFTKEQIDQNLESMLLKANIPDVYHEKYLMYLVRNFNFTDKGVEAIYDYKALKEMNFNISQAALEAQIIQLKCPAMIFSPKNYAKNLQKLKNVSIYEVNYNHRVEYTAHEVERITKWIQAHTLSEEERLKNLLGINSGKSQDMACLA